MFQKLKISNSQLMNMLFKLNIKTYYLNYKVGTHMEVIRTISELKNRLAKAKGKQLGFVPTMGYFHEGHTSLMDAARKENDLVVTSVFVNPLQFGPNEDFEKYPLDESQDIQMAKHHGVDILFIPTNSDMYPRKMTITMHAESITSILCGRSRPGHFDGVVTVLTKLFNLIEPNKVYFGLKDAQQFSVVDNLIKDLNFPIQLVGLPTIREMSGLAKSSRNVNLTDSERSEAIWLYKSLQAGQQLIIDGEKCPDKIMHIVKDMIITHTTGTIDYVEMYRYPELQPVTSQIETQIIIAIAVQFSHARLIDNIIVDQTGMLIERI